MTLVQHGPAEPSPFAHRIARFRSHSRLCWDILSVLELRGRAGCRTCLRLLGNRNGYNSEFKWGNAAGGLKPYFAFSDWPSDFRKQRGRLVPDARSFTVWPTKTRQLRSAEARFDP